MTSKIENESASRLDVDVIDEMRSESGYNILPSGISILERHNIGIMLAANETVIIQALV
jgi:hypothetical protein